MCWGRFNAIDLVLNFLVWEIKSLLKAADKAKVPTLPTAPNAFQTSEAPNGAENPFTIIKAAFEGRAWDESGNKEEDLKPMLEEAR